MTPQRAIRTVRRAEFCPVSDRFCFAAGWSNRSCCLGSFWFLLKPLFRNALGAPGSAGGYISGCSSIEAPSHPEQARNLRMAACFVSAKMGRVPFGTDPPLPLCRCSAKTALASQPRRRLSSRLLLLGEARTPWLYPIFRPVAGLPRRRLASSGLCWPECFWRRPAAGDSSRSKERPRRPSLPTGPIPRGPGEFQEATYDDPEDADGYYNIAATYHRLGRQGHCQADLSQAEKYYNHCLDRNPNHAECYRGLAVLLAEQGRKDEAFRLIEGWVQREPGLGRRQGRIRPAQRRVRQPPGGQGPPDRGPGSPARQLAGADGAGQNPRGRRRQSPGAGQLSALALSSDNRQPQVAARVNVPVQAASAVRPPACAPRGAAPPTVEMGTRMADRTHPLQ